MTTTDRVRSYIKGMPVPPRPVLDIAVKRSRWLVPVSAAMAVLALLFVFTIVRPGQSSPAFNNDLPVSLPDKWGRYSYVTGDVASSPPGPAIAVYTHGFGVEMFDLPQALVLSARGDVYRRVGLAEERSGPLDQGDPAPMVLSPDGRYLAIGTHGGLGNLALLDLTTGGVTILPAREGAAIRPLAWSPDGRYVAALDMDKESASQGPDGTLVLFDTHTRAEPLVFAAHHGVSMAAFSPNGTEIAVQSVAALVVTDLAGKVLRRLETSGGELRSGTAWSPDGNLIALIDAEMIPEIGLRYGPITVRFVDATGKGGAVPDPLKSTHPSGTSLSALTVWTAPHRIILRQGNELVEVDVESHAVRKAAEFDTGPWDNYGVGDPQFASSLMLDVQTRPAGAPDRGPWPLWLQIPLFAALVLVGFIVFRRVRRNRPSRASG